MGAGCSGKRDGARGQGDVRRADTRAVVNRGGGAAPGPSGLPRDIFVEMKGGDIFLRNIGVWSPSSFHIFRLLFVAPHPKIEVKSFTVLALMICEGQ
jgi:hypothetical protein